MGKPQKVECLGFTFASSPAVVGRKTTKFDQAGLVCMQLQTKLAQATFQFFSEEFVII